jgi:hypothetical protein
MFLITGLGICLDLDVDERTTSELEEEIEQEFKNTPNSKS